MNITHDAQGNAVALVTNRTTGAALVVPNDVTDLPKQPTSGLFVGTGGNVKVDMADGTTVTFNALAGGYIHAFAVRRVYATTTTATNILALY